MAETKTIKPASPETPKQPESKSGSRTSTKTILIVVIVLTVICAVICGVILLVSGLFVQQGISQLESELEPFKEDFIQFEDDMRDLNDKDKDDFRIFDEGKSWPDDVPADVPEFKQGKIRSVSRIAPSTAEEAWNFIIEDVPAKALGDYQDALKAAGWTINVELGIGAGYTAATLESESLALQLAITDGTAVLTVIREK